MAKKKKFELDDQFDIDGEFDMPDFDYDLGEPKDDRTPATKFAAGALGAVKDTVVSPNTVRTLIKEALPKGYGSALDLTDKGVSSLKSLYDSSVKELKPLTNDLKRSVQKILPSIEKSMPESFAKKVKDWAVTSDQKKAQYEQSLADQKESVIQSQMAEVFGDVADQQQKDRAVDKAENRIRDGIEKTRYADSMALAGDTRTASMQQVAFNERVTTPYYRKSLELQIRGFFLAQESFEEQKKQNALVERGLQEITKNTGLPEFVKLQNKEYLAQVLRNKFLDGAGSWLIDKRKEFTRNIANRVLKGGQQKIKDYGDQFRNGLGYVDQLADLRELQAGMGPGGPSGAELAGGVAGGIVGDNLVGRAAKKLRGYAEQNENVVKGGNKLQYWSENAPQIAGEWAKGYAGDDLPVIGGFVRWLKDEVSSELRGPDTTMDIDNIGALAGPDIFSRKTNKAITEIIPGYLARILREVTVFRTGDTKTQLLEYDYSKNNFGNRDKIQKNIFNSLIKQQDVNSNKEDVLKLVNALDKNGTLTEEEKLILGRQLTKDNLSNQLGDHKRYEDNYTYQGKASEHADKFTKLFQDYFADDKLGDKKTVFAREYNRLGSGIDDQRKKIQDLVNAGQLQHLYELGIIDEQTGQLDMTKMLDYYLSQAEPPRLNDNSPRPAPRRNNRRRGGQGPTPPAPVPPPPPGPIIPPAPGLPGEPPRYQPPAPVINNREDFDRVVGAVEQASSKSETQLVYEVLQRIEKKLAEGITLNGGLYGDIRQGAQDAGQRLRDLRLGDLANRGWEATKKTAGWVKDKTFQSGRLAGSTIGMGWRGAKELTNKATERLRGIADVYIEGELIPKLRKAKLIAGEYYDQASGEVIKNFKDIRGAVVDAAGNVLLTAEEAKKAFIREGLHKKLLTAMGATLKTGKELIGKGLRGLTGFYGAVATKAWELTDKLINGPQDIYVRGKTDPVLLAVTMRSGGYLSKVTGKVIESPRDIDGAVVDQTGEVVLTAEQLASGLLDKRGRPLTTGWRRAARALKDTMLFGWNKLKQGGDWVMDKAKGIFSKLGLPNLSLDFSVGYQTRTANRLLLDIRDMLNARLPGDTTTFDPLPTTNDLSAKLNPKRSIAAVKKKLEKVKERFNAAKDKVKKWSFKGTKDKLAEKATITKDQMSTLFEKYFGKKKVSGDVDGDGVREGSWKDQLNKRTQQAKDKITQAGQTAKGYGTAGMGLLGKGGNAVRDWWQKRKEANQESDGVDIDIDAANGRGRPRGPRGPASGPAPAGFWNKTKHYGKKGLKGLWGAGKWALGAAGLGTVSALGSAAMTAGSWLLGGAATIAGGIGSILASPVVLTAAAVAGLAYGGYKLYKHLTKKKLTPMSTPRYVQYGFLATDADHVQPVFELEDLISKGVVISGEEATLDTKKIDWDKALAMFGVEKSNEQATINWVTWFAKRFKPVYLTHLQVMRGIDPSKSLSDVDDLPSEQKQNYLKMVAMPDGPYNVTNSPFPGVDSLVAGSSEVAAAFELARTEALKDTNGKSTVPKAAVVGVAGGAAAVAAVGKASPASGPATTDSLRKSSVPEIPASKLSSIAAAGLISSIESNDRGMVEQTSEEMFADAFSTDRIDALTAIRYKTYGLQEMAADKVRAIALLERYVYKGVKYKGLVASWGGSIEQALMANGGNFGVAGAANKNAYDWLSWFNLRFLPVYLRHLTAMTAATGKTDMALAANSIKPAQAVQVATEVYTTNSSYNDQKTSVWQIPTSPWPGYELNMDVKTTDGNMQGLKDLAKKVVLEEETASKTGMDSNGKIVGMKNQGTWDKIWNGQRDASGKVIDQKSGNVFTRAFESAKEAVGMGGGQEIAQPGKGTGGDINALPKPTGNGSWAALKDLILGASKMVGVDEKLMTSMAAIESGFNYIAKAGTSSATGLYQFISGTWKSMLKKYGAKYGIDPSTPPTDPRANALMGAEYIKENTQSLSSLGRKLTDTDLYLAHFLGSGGAKKLLSADPNALGAQLLPSAAAANGSIFYDNGRARTVAEIHQLVTKMVANKAKQFGVAYGSEKVVEGTKTSAATDAGPKGQAITGATPAGTTIGQESAPASPVPAPASNAISKIPVADMTPIPSIPSTQAAPSPVTPSPQVAPDAPAPSPVSQAPTGLTREAMQIAMQNQARDNVGEAIGGLGKVLSEQLGVQKLLLEAVRDTNRILGKMTNMVTPVVAPKDANTPAAKGAPAAQRQMEDTPRAPVSMSKR